MNETVKGLSEGKIFYTNKELNVPELEWNPHPSFTGVFLKHLVKGDSSDGKFSCHLIRIKEGFEIGEHIHSDKWEFINIVGGTGKGKIAGKEFACELGVSMVVPENVKHRIVAGSGDVYLLAKFIPALL